MGHKTIAALLVEKGENINAQGGEYENPLYAALYTDHKAIAMLLIEKGGRHQCAGRMVWKCTSGSIGWKPSGNCRASDREGADLNA